MNPNLTSVELLKHLRSLFLSSATALLPIKNILVAYSGGLDSHVLLHLLSGIPRSEINLRAVYIDHGLQAESSQWATHCAHVCSQLKVSFESIRLDLSIESGSSIEEVARNSRYRALHAKLKHDEVLLTAHHQNDQAETLLLRLFRGAGVDGLAAMAPLREFSAEFGSFDDLKLHARPLLNYSRASLEAYAEQHQLNYINDPSNQDADFDRNFLRNHIMPELRQRWPSIDKSIARAAIIQSDTRALLSDSIKDDLSLMTHQDGVKQSRMRLDVLIQCSKAKQALILREWITQNGFLNPSDKKLKHVFSDLFEAKSDAQPLIKWQGAELRRFQGMLYLARPLAEHDASLVIPWKPVESLVIADLGIRISPEELANYPDISDITVRFRQGGEKIDYAKRGVLSLKNLLHEKQVPPWMRDRLPLVYQGERLLKVIGLEEYPQHSVANKTIDKSHPPTF